MKSPITTDNELVKEFGIPASADLDPIFKLGYVRAQIDEFKKVLYRNRVDAVISLGLIENASKAGKDELEGKLRENLANYRNVIRQMAQSLEIMEKLKSELEPLAQKSTPAA